MIQRLTLKKGQDTSFGGDVSVPNPLGLSFPTRLVVGEVTNGCQTGQVVTVSVWLGFGRQEQLSTALLQTVL